MLGLRHSPSQLARSHIDQLLHHRVHAVYRYALPTLVYCQLIVMHLFLTASPRWVAIANAILR
jgi:hypothetical protein